MMNSEKVVETIKKWYKEISFPEKYDEEFYDALKTVYVDENIGIDDYDIFY